MNTSYNYYQKVIDRFGVRRNTSITDDSNLSNNETTDDSKPMMINFSSISSKSFSSGLKSKRHLKLIRKDHFESIKSFLHEMKNLKHSTAVDYVQIIADFLQFSPECDIEDYIRYLKFKSGYSDKENQEEFSVTGTFIKHCHILKKYLEHVYQQDVPSVRIIHYKRPLNVDIYPYPKVTKEQSL